MTEKMKALLADFGGSAWELFKATGILLPVSGGAGPQGYNETADLLTKTVDGVALDDLWAEFNATIELLNGERDPLMQWLTFQNNIEFEQVMPIVEHDFELADEFGQPRGIRLGKPWNMGFDFEYYDLGIRYTFRYLGRAPAGQIRALNNSALNADQRLVMRTVLNQLFTNVTRQATLEDTGTVVNVYPFYNGDQTALPVVPPSWKTYDHLVTHTHFLVSGAASVVSGDLDDMWDHVYHHGYLQGNSKLFLLANRQEADIIRKFRVLTTNDKYDFLAKSGTPGTTFFGTMVGQFPTAPAGDFDTFPGFIGSYGDINVIQEDLIPAGYMVLLVSQGPFDPGNPIGIREHPNAQLRGLKLIPQFERYPLRESFYHHAIGAGTRHPGAGVVMQVKATGSYVAPTITRLGGFGDVRH